MAWFDCAQHRPLGPQTEPRLFKKNKLIFHTMVGTLAGTENYFKLDGYSGVESHFGVGGFGEKWQWQDSDYQADAQLQGNDDCISVETADKGAPFAAWSGSDVPAWTAAQVEANAQILAEAHRRHGIPLVLITDTEDATRGVGYHRQGVDPYRKHGELYSEAFGKVCPGDRRVAQVPQVITRAIQIVNGEDDMTPEEHNQLARLSFGIDNGGATPFSQQGEITDRLRTVDGRLVSVEGVVRRLEAAVAALADDETQIKAAIATAIDGVVADVDEQHLADLLKANGVVGQTPQQTRDILRDLLLLGLNSASPT